MLSLWRLCAFTQSRPMNKFCPGICRWSRRLLKQHRKSWSDWAKIPVGLILRKQKSVIEQADVKISTAILLQRKVRLKNEKRDQYHRKNCFSVTKRSEGNHRMRRTVHLYLPGSGDQRWRNGLCMLWNHEFGIQGLSSITPGRGICSVNSENVRISYVGHRSFCCGVHYCIKELSLWKDAV